MSKKKRPQKNNENLTTRGTMKVVEQNKTKSREDMEKIRGINDALKFEDSPKL